MYYLLAGAIFFAGFFAVHALLALAVGAVRLVSGQRVARLRPSLGARVWLALNIAPVAGAGAAALFVLVSYFAYEPAHTNEGIGWPLLTGAALGIAGLVRSLWRFRAVGRVTRELVRNWESHSSPAALPGLAQSVHCLDHAFPLIAVVGIVRPRIFVAATVLDHLQEEELSAAIAHELGHQKAHDNLKRVVVNFCAELAWWVPGTPALRVHWVNAAELAADEFAATGHRARSLNLASALVKLARITPAGARPAMPAGAFLVEATGDILTRRINWLVNDNRAATETSGQYLQWFTVAAVLVFGLLAAGALRFGLLSVLHQVIESIVQ